jgi:subtilisin family serine protease
MRLRMAVALAAACALWLAVPASAEAEGRVALVFLPTEPAPKLPLLGSFAQRDMTVALTNPTLGGYDPRQMMLDIGQGARVSGRGYDRKLKGLLFVREDGRARLGDWGRVLKRAREAPGDLLPGLLAREVEKAGGRVVYAGPEGPDQVEAIAAAGPDGRVDPALLGPASRVTDGWREATLLVAQLPPDAAGLRALDTLLEARRPDDLVVAVRAPREGRLPLLPTGILGPGFEGGLAYSTTTRRAGLVAAPDLTATILDHLGIELPDEVQGRVLERRDGSASDLRDTAGRLDVVSGRRDPAVRYLLLGWLLLGAILWLVAKGQGLRAAMRVSFLSALWFPGLALVTAAIRPTRMTETAILLGGSLLLGAFSDRAVRWPLAPALPAVVVLVAHAVDLALGSPLIGQSLVGPNPKGGARFFGIGNELEIALSAIVLLGTGAALSARDGRGAPQAFAAASAAVAVVMGAGRLGADVGGVITLGAGAAVAVLASLPGGPSRRAILIALIVPVLAVGALLALDLVTGGDAHLTKSVSDAKGPGDLVDIVQRRLRISLSGVEKGTLPFSLGVALIMLVVGIRRRRRLLEPLSEAGPGAARAFSAGIAGTFAATIVGALANDSGPLMLLVGTAALALAIAYVQGRPVQSG